MLTLTELNSLTEKYGFPEEAGHFFAMAGEKVLGSREASEQLVLALDAIIHCDDDFSRVEPFLDRVSEITGIGRRSVDMLFRLVTSDEAFRIYTDAGISEAIALDTISANIIAELEENRRVYGDWGTFVLWFHTRLYGRRLYKLGRLQFETMEDPDEVFCHIISFLPFNMEAVKASLEQAYTFFGFDRRHRPMKVITETWMLHPAFRDLFREGSELKKFSELFTLTEYKDTDSELWYIFWKPEGTPVSEFPSETSLQRSCKEYLLRGGQLGEGSGYFYYTPAGFAHMD